MRFRLIDVAKEDFPVQRLCKVLDVSPSGYFAWKSQPSSAVSTCTRICMLPPTDGLDVLAA